MKIIKNILVLFLGAVFMITSSGYMLYKANCACTGNEQTTVFVRPETCEDTFHKHHKHDIDNSEIACTAHECHECVSHTKTCGCDSPEIIFLKLKDKAVDEEVKFVKVHYATLSIASVHILKTLCSDMIDEPDTKSWTDPPPNLSSSLDFLVKIQQLKIPSLA